MKLGIFVLVFLLALSLTFALPVPPPPPVPGQPAFSFAQHAREQLHVKRVAMPSGVASGNILPVAVHVQNVDEVSLDNGLSVTVSLPQLGIRKRIGPGTILARKETTKTIVLSIPQTTPQGTYLARITVSSDSFHRTLYRIITVQ